MRTSFSTLPDNSFSGAGTARRLAHSDSTKAENNNSWFNEKPTDLFKKENVALKMLQDIKQLIAVFHF